MQASQQVTINDEDLAPWAELIANDEDLAPWAEQIVKGTKKSETKLGCSYT